MIIHKYQVRVAYETKGLSNSPVSPVVFPCPYALTSGNIVINGFFGWHDEDTQQAKGTDGDCVKWFRMQRERKKGG